jgi:hypothetical protein
MAHGGLHLYFRAPAGRTSTGTPLVGALSRADVEQLLTRRQKVSTSAERSWDAYQGCSQDKHKTRHELKRLARNAAELMGLSAALEAGGIQLELLTGPLTGVHDPNGMGAMLFAVLAVAAQLDREYIREKTLEGQQAAAAKGNHGGRPKVIDDDMLLFARALKDKGTPIPEIAKKPSIKTGKNAGKHPSVASLYRALAETDSQHAATRP